LSEDFHIGLKTGKYCMRAQRLSPMEEQRPPYLYAEYLGRLTMSAAVGQANSGHVDYVPYWLVEK